MRTFSPERCASFVSAVVQEAAAMVAIALFLGMIGVWAVIIADKIQ